MTESSATMPPAVGKTLKDSLVRALSPEWIWRLKRLKRPYTFWVLRRALRKELQEAGLSDLNRFADHAAACRLLKKPDQIPLTEQQHHAVLSIDYHRLEKALSFQEPRPGFGAGISQELCSSLDKFINLYGYKPICETCVAALADYARFNRDSSSPNVRVEKWLEEARSKHPAQAPAGEREDGTATIKLTREEIHAGSVRDLSSFFLSRHSIRNFADEPVEFAKITRAISLARSAPSVCNRQSARVYVAQGKSDCRAVLSLQNGNRGFGHALNNVLIVTSELQSFVSIDERNQCWIDGALFAMSLVYALHAEGLGTCCLNWCAPADRDRRLHEMVGIPQSEVVIMMIAVGHIAEELQVARSRRLPLHEIMRVKPSGSISSSSDS
ncbi:MAG: nitroreductase family protein [Chthoniobacterales bacterium]|nr:nitroreductase family protein [Chthoniobacterales bacterium]